MGNVIGIIGGMGPMATCDLMQKIIEHTDAGNDREHIHTVIDCNTDIPDRTEAIVNRGESPLPEMVKSAVRLQAMGAKALLMACNTAHYFLKDLETYIDIPVISMPQETAGYLREQGLSKVAVLGTDGTMRSGVYEDTLARFGISCTYPGQEDQRLLMSLIYEYVKAGKEYPYPENIYGMVDRLKDRGVQALILGCTELPILFAKLDVALTVVDPTEILACAAIRFAGGALK